MLPINNYAELENDIKQLEKWMVDFSFYNYQYSENVIDIINDILNNLNIKNTYIIQEINDFIKKNQFTTIREALDNLTKNHFINFIKFLIDNLRIDLALYQARQSGFIKNFNYEYIVLCMGSLDVRNRGDLGGRYQTIPLYARDLANKDQKVLIINVDHGFNPEHNLDLFETPAEYNNNLKIINIRTKIENIELLLKDLLTPAILDKKEIILHSFACISHSAFGYPCIDEWFDNLTAPQKKQLTFIAGYFDSYRYNVLFCGDLTAKANDINMQYQEITYNKLNLIKNQFDEPNNPQCNDSSTNQEQLFTELNNLFAPIKWVTLPRNRELSLNALHAIKSQDSQKSIASTSSSSLFFSGWDKDPIKLQQEAQDAALARSLQEAEQDAVLARLLQEAEYDNQAAIMKAFHELNFT